MLIWYILYFTSNLNILLETIMDRVSPATCSVIGPGRWPRINLKTIAQKVSWKPPSAKNIKRKKSPSEQCNPPQVVFQSPNFISHVRGHLLLTIYGWLTSVRYYWHDIVCNMCYLSVQTHICAPEPKFGTTNRCDDDVWCCKTSPTN